MKSLINNNVISASYLAMNGKGLLPSVAVLRDVHPVYKMDASGSKTDEIIAFRYNLTCPESFSTFNIKVEGSKPIITSDALELADDVVYVDINPEAVTIKPYEISFGNAKLSMSAPSIRLHKD